jgi:hypothetical protein
VKTNAKMRKEQEKGMQAHLLSSPVKSSTPPRYSSVSASKPMSVCLRSRPSRRYPRKHCASQSSSSELPNEPGRSLRKIVTHMCAYIRKKLRERRKKWLYREGKKKTKVRDGVLKSTLLLFFSIV